jgi:hypothetical protein
VIEGMFHNNIIDKNLPSLKNSVGNAALYVKKILAKNVVGAFDDCRQM